MAAIALVAPPPQSAASSAVRPAPWRLILAVTVPFWLFMTCERVLIFLLARPSSPLIIIAPPGVRIGQHLLLLPLLLLCYAGALRVGWPRVHRAAALSAHLTLAALFALAARPALVGFGALYEGNRGLLAELVTSSVGGELLAQLWLSSFADFMLSYWFGLVLLVGVRTYLELKDEKRRALRLESECTHSRLEALGRQLSPHFIFNTLHAAVSMVRREPAIAEQMLVRLAELLRRAFREGEIGQVPLAREAEFVRKYLEIQSLRFAERLEFEIDVPGEVADALVPGLLLQPLAENAVVHGVKSDSDSLQVRVRARRERDELVLEVENTPAPVSLAAGSVEGVGLGATRERLRTLFGTAQQLALMARADGAVVAQVRIPFARAAQEAAA